MARSDWDLRGILFFTNDDFPYMDIYDYVKNESKYIPIAYIADLLNLSEQRFVDMLNEPANSKRHLITNYEEGFRSGSYDFTRYRVFEYDTDITVELADFEYWLDDNYELLKKNNAVQVKEPYQQKITVLQTRVAELETENTKLKEKVTELENTALPGGKIPKLRAMWRYILDLEERGNSDSAIREALKGDGFSYATADALLYDGDGKTLDAVKKWRKRKDEEGDI